MGLGTISSWPLASPILPSREIQKVTNFASSRRLNFTLANLSIARRGSHKNGPEDESASLFTTPSSSLGCPDVRSREIAEVVES
jgi:hypothetical protein